MKIIDLLKKIEEKIAKIPDKKKYLKNISDYFMKQDLLSVCDINDDQAEVLSKDLTGTEEIDRPIIDQWIKKHFETDETSLASVHGEVKSLAELIKEQNANWWKELGAASDFKYIFEIGKEELGFKICTPQVLVSSIPEEENGSGFCSFLESESKQVKDKRFLLIPLNIRNGHWVLGKVCIEDKRITEGVLIDSLSGDKSANQVFSKVLEGLSCLKSSIVFDPKCIQQDGFRCFDYVCQEIFGIIGKEDSPVLNAANGKELRQAIGQCIATKLQCALPEEMVFYTPVKSEPIVISIDDPEVQKAYDIFVDKLREKYPEAKDAETLTFSSTPSGLSFSPSSIDTLSSTSSKKARSLGENRPTISPVKSEALDELRKSKSDSASEVEAAETEFEVNYDDSSDEDDEGETISKDRLEGLLVKTGAAYTAKAGEKESEKLDRMARKISFLLFALGRLILRSAAVKPYYRYLKKQHLILANAEFQLFKNSVIEVFKKQFGWGEDEVETFKLQVWSFFLKNFRTSAKGRYATEVEILNVALKETLIQAKLISHPKSDIDVIVSSLAGEIKLPKRTVPDGGTPSFEISQNNINYQLAAIALFLYRLARRQFKSFSQEAKKTETTKTVISKIRDVDLKTKVTLNSDFTRTDYLLFFFAYPSILDPAVAKAAEGKEYKGSSASIAKYSAKGKTARILTDDMLKLVANPSDKTDKSYYGFLIKFYYLLQQIEVGRNPATLIINAILIKMIMEHDYQWSDVLPANKEQQAMTAANHPRLIHPMTLSDAPDAAAVLNGEFNSFLPFQLKQWSERGGKPRGYAAILARKQYAIVSAFFKDHVKTPLETASDKKVVEELSKLSIDYYNPGGKK